jgi:hypothetical protein
MQKKIDKNIKKLKVDNISEQETDGYREVYRSYSKDGKILSEKDNQEILKIRKFFGKVAEVEIESGLTIALGKGTYEFAKVSCKVKLPCYVEEVAEAQNCAVRLVEEKLIEQIEEIKSDWSEVNDKYSKKEFGDVNDEF